VPGFNFRIPLSCKGVDSKILNPINTWSDKADFNACAKKLAGSFAKNFEKYADGTPDHVIKNGGPNMAAFE